MQIASPENRKKGELQNKFHKEFKTALINKDKDSIFKVFSNFLNLSEESIKDLNLAELDDSMIFYSQYYNKFFEELEHLNSINTKLTDEELETKNELEKIVPILPRVKSKLISLTGLTSFPG